MRDKIYDIIKNANRGLNVLDIVKELTSNYEAEDIKKATTVIDDLCRDGRIRSTSGNTYVINEMITGYIDEHERGNAHVILSDGDDIFISRDNMNGAHDKDLVIVNKVFKNGKETEDYKVHRILKRNLGSNVAEVINKDGKLIVLPVTSDLPYDVVIEDTDINLVDGLLVHLDYVGELSKNKVLARIDRVMGHKNALLNPGQEPTEVSGEIAKIACEFDISLLFPPEVLEEAKKFPKSLSEEMIQDGLDNGRVDFRNDLVYTIDGKDTKDIDDAISVKILPNGNYELAVHIADVSHYVKPGSAIWKEAEKRGNSNYLGNKVIPMLPVELSNGICSLNPNEDRFTTSCIMEIDHSGKVVNKKVCKGIIKSKKKMNYDAVQALIDKDYNSDELFDLYTLKDGETLKDVAIKYRVTEEELLELNPNNTKELKVPSYKTLVYTLRDGETLSDVAASNGMTVDELLEYNPDFNIKNKVVNVPCSKIIENAHRLSKVIDAMKQRRGEIRFVSDETKIKQDDIDVPYEVVPRDQRPSERLIENFMVAANESVAEFLEEYNLATYRIHDVPLQKKMDEYLHLLETLGIHYNGKINTENISSADCQRLLEFLEDEKLFKVLNKRLLRCMPKAVYSTENRGHFGIASPKYTHFTSPIRRFDDLLNHTSIGYILNNEIVEDKFIKSWRSYLTTICEHISECERNSEKCEYAVDDMLKAWYMTSHIGEEFEATVDSLMQGYFFVQTDNYIDGRVDVIEKQNAEELTEDNRYFGINGYYDYNDQIMAYTRNGRVDLRYGDRVLVRCIDSDPYAREIDFALIRKL